MTKRHAFTLIELLVVISIIAVLMAVLMPALRYAKQQATGAVCLGHERSLILAWHTYPQDNEDKLVGGNPYPNSQNYDIAWVQAPQNEAREVMLGAGSQPTESGDLAYKYEVMGLERGRLWPYLKTAKVYHCPGDQRKIQAENSAFRSYSILWTMHGAYSRQHESDPVYDTGEVAHTYTEIRRPATKLVFVEDQDDRGWNMGSWVMNPLGERWTDSLGLWHADSGTLAFADGHAQRRKWRDKRTIEYFKDPYDSSFAHSTPENPNPDLKFVQEAYLPTGKGPGQHR
ncbi:MAG: type II secretion system protein [Phycisphaeraceae bacterium]|nr:type II secretion system protein [Phycisphaeraceae bacterium]